MRAPRPRITASVVALALIVAAALLLLWPLRVNGVHGTAVSPTYDRYIAFSSTDPLPARSSNDAYSSALSVVIDGPHHVVEHRRLVGGGLLIGGFVIAAGVVASATWRRRRVAP